MAKIKPIALKNVYRNSLIAIVVTAIFTRFYELSILPPGITLGETRVGTAAFNLLHHGLLPSFGSISGGSPLLVFFESIAMAIFGTTPWALRIIPALLGVLAVYCLYLWVSRWFSIRTALFASFLLAVTPWAVTISRNIEPASLGVILISSLYLFATKLYHSKSNKDAIILGVVCLLAGLAGPVGWASLLVLGSSVFVISIVNMKNFKPATVYAWLCVGIVITILTLLYASLVHISQKIFILSAIGGMFTNFFLSLGAYNLHGDLDYYHNLAGLPLLNVFVGIMFIAGLLLTATKFSSNVNKVFLVGAAVALIPAIISGVNAPNAAHLILTLPFVLIMAAIGIEYMLDTWCNTFPINSAARAVGQGAIGILLLLTAYQGYLQYFVAWKDSTETYFVYNQTDIGIAKWVGNLPKNTSAVIVVSKDDQTVLNYLLISKTNYTYLTSANAATLLKTRPLNLVLSPSNQDTLIPLLKTNASGSTIKPHTSLFDGEYIYYTYEIIK